MAIPDAHHDEPIEPILPEIPDPAVKIPLKLEDWASVLILSSLALITFGNVIGRYLTDTSFAWTEEISVFLLIVLTMTAGASAFVRNQHIRIELIADGGSAQRRRRLALISAVVVLLFFILLAVLSARMAYDDYSYGDTSPAIGVPAWWYSIWMPILASAIALRMAGMLRRLLRARA
ncbi:TRAP transporter permease DctQ [Pollutimonas subterranea]|uniref:TRAP transporter small permease protein n=1 Tax=Pollutimonas subterranea TaxID=2045210 RepID=A0A2N4U536_9BURK|nr:TRAP transporter small permease [Pollutimonas subterranea]PLC50124.1 TRAP transporter permease DctQ [Pollutimonas subterranea]